jgi:DNA-binding transcriptional ArsR family regulator
MSKQAVTDRITMSNQSVTKLDAFHALGDATRRALLELLRAAPRTVNDLARTFPMSRPAISKHLRILRQAGLVIERRRGRNRYYRLVPEAVEAVADWVATLRRPIRPGDAVPGSPEPAKSPSAPRGPDWAPWS